MLSNHMLQKPGQKLCETTILMILLQNKWDKKFCQITGLFEFSSKNKPKIMWNHNTDVFASKQMR